MPVFKLLPKEVLRQGFPDGRWFVQNFFGFVFKPSILSFWLRYLYHGLCVKEDRLILIITSGTPHYETHLNIQMVCAAALACVNYAKKHTKCAKQTLKREKKAVAF